MGFSFAVDLFQLPIGGADIILGVQWLKTLGSVTIDYSLLKMSFTFLGQPTSLSVDIPMLPSPTSAQQLKRLSQTHNISALYHLTRVPDPLPTSRVYPFSTPQTPPPTKHNPSYSTFFFSATRHYFRNPASFLLPAPSPTTSISFPTPAQ